MANLNSKDNTFTLKDFLYKEVQRDWPGYTEGDQQLLKRILFRYVGVFMIMTCSVCLRSGGGEGGVLAKTGLHAANDIQRRCD